MRDKLKELTKDTAVYGISTIFGRLIGFVLIPFLSQFFSKEQMGIYGNIYSYVGFFNIVFIYGMDAAFLKFSSFAKDEEKQAIFSTPFIFVILSTVLISIIGIFNLGNLGILMGLNTADYYLNYYVLIILFFDTIALIPFAHLRLKRKAKKFAFIKMINISLNLVSNIVLVGVYNFGIEAVLISNAVASIITFLILLPDVNEFIIWKVDIQLLKKMLNFGLPYVPASLSAVAVQTIDRPILTYLTDLKITGIYTTNYKLGIAMMLFVGMFQYAWQPFFLNNAKEKNAKELFSKVLTAFVLAGSFMVLIISLFVDNFASFPISASRTIIDSKFWSGLSIVPIILISYLFHGMYIVFQAGIYIKEKTKYFPIITGVGAIVNVAINFAVIPTMGMMGAAYATLASYFIMMSMIFVMVQKVYYIKYEFGKVSTTIILLLICGVIYYNLYYSGYLNLYTKTIILISYPTALFIFRVLRVSELKNLISVFKNKKRK